VLATPEPAEWGIIAPTYRDAWSTCVAGPSGLLVALGTSEAEIKTGRSATVVRALRSYGEVHLYNGHVVRVDSADDGALRVQGKNLSGAWCDEIGLWIRWETAWDESLAFAARMGESRIVATGTPKASRPAAKLIRRLIKEDSTVVTRLRTIDNAANLSDAFLNAVVGRSKGTRLERQELEGELLEDIPGALWNRAVIDQGRTEPNVINLELSRVVVAIDPAVTVTEQSDETGIIVAGEDRNGHGYVLADYSIKATPEGCMRRAVWAYKKHHADCIVAEINNGGDYLGTVLRHVDANVPYRQVRASRGKALRAEPVSALYEQGRIHHCGSFPELEEQMCAMIPGIDSGYDDRVDALVYAVTELRGLSGGDWLSVYGTVRCGNCGTVFHLQPECPHCHHPYTKEQAA
jgi:predicted phage terminase large subunit-like protein